MTISIRQKRTNQLEASCNRATLRCIKHENSLKRARAIRKATFKTLKLYEEESRKLLTKSS